MAEKIGDVCGDSGQSSPFHVITLNRGGSISTGWLPGKEDIVLVDVRYLDGQRRGGASQQCS